ncbi:MAG: right-handed parallel beta-helix repeat-containing protein [Deltaproteobacteria bacterium]|nr:right-handed parallel beta-helix repeat-containing protein [Deltaproteobacteria bacterium]
MNSATRPAGRLLSVAIIFVAALCSMAQIVPPPPRNGLVLKVDPTDPRAFQTIGQAVAAARRFDVISISSNGNPYNECIDVVGRFDVEFRGSKGKTKVVIDGTGACPASQPAFSISLSRHIYIKNIELMGNPAGTGFFVDHSGDVRLIGVVASGFADCGLRTTLSTLATYVEDSIFTDNPGGGFCLNGNGFYFDNVHTDRNGDAGIQFEGVSGGRGINAWFINLYSGPEQAVGITHGAGAGLDNVAVTRSTFGARGTTPQPGAMGITGSGRYLEVTRASLYGMGINVGASGWLSRNVISDCPATGIRIGPTPLGMWLQANNVSNCDGLGYDLAGTFAERNISRENGGGGFLARDGVFLERNTARDDGGPGFARVGTDNAGRGNRSDDAVPPDFE